MPNPVKIMELLWPIAGFVSGSIPFSYLAGRFLGGKDVRREGSGNVGATNVFRVAGRKAGIVAAVGDVLKSLIPVLAARFTGVDPSWQAATAAAVVLGHCYSPFLTFKGGKGVFSTITVAIVLFWPAGLIFAFIWLIVFRLAGYVSLASIIATASLPVTSVIIGSERPITIFFLLSAFFITWKHRANISRLLSGTESKMR